MVTGERRGESGLLRPSLHPSPAGCLGPEDLPPKPVTLAGVLWPLPPPPLQPGSFSGPCNTKPWLKDCKRQRGRSQPLPSASARTSSPLALSKLFLRLEPRLLTALEFQLLPRPSTTCKQLPLTQNCLWVLTPPTGHGPHPQTSSLPETFPTVPSWWLSPSKPRAF